MRLSRVGADLYPSSSFPLRCSLIIADLLSVSAGYCMAVNWWSRALAVISSSTVRWIIPIESVCRKVFRLFSRYLIVSTKSIVWSMEKVSQLGLDSGPAVSQASQTTEGAIIYH